MAWQKLDSDFSTKILAMIVSLRHFFGWLVSVFRSREDLVLENLALRRQLLALHAQQPRRRLTALHKLFWVALRTFWSGWTKPLILVTPRTVVNWHRAGFRLYWTWVSRISQAGGRKRVSEEVRALIFRMVAENPTWGAPRIHGELLKLGFEVSERSVSRWIRRAPRDPDFFLSFPRRQRKNCQLQRIVLFLLRMKAPPTIFHSDSLARTSPVGALIHSHSRSVCVS
jgi:hypothetical protein